MDVRTAVAVSMLPASRSALAAAFKLARHDSGTGAAALERVWSAVGRGTPLGAGEPGAVLERAEQGMAVAARAGIRPLPLFDPEYPPLLLAIPDPPPVLWVRGRVEALSGRAVAIVGSRAATDYARAVAERLAAELASSGIVVVSGLARGVDSAAHRGCLRAGGCTIAVLGSGLDRIYPAEHRLLADEIAGTGAVVSELAPGAPPLPEHFPLRNRIISGLALATVVVEASEGSGSLITARAALEQGRDVMAVPGSVLSGRNRGSHALLKDGARVVETADDILQDLGWSSAVPTAARSRAAAPDPLLDRMEPGETYDLDALSAATGMQAAPLLIRLTELELSGRVVTSRGRFRRA